MLKSHNQQELEFDFFISFLQHAIEGEDEYIKLVQPILSDVIQVVNQEKGISELDSVGLNVKILLSQKANSLFSGLSTDKLNRTIYNDILNVLNENKRHALA